MPEKPAYEKLKKRIALLEQESKQRKRFEKINRSLFKISNAVNTTSSLDDLFRAIHSALTPVIDTTNFYISLYDREKDTLTFPYFVDTVDECYPAVIAASRTVSLTALVIKKKDPVLINKAEILSQREGTNLTVPACTPAEIWLGVPLKNEGEIIGVMAVQNYQDPDCYDQTDVNVLVSVANQVAIALQHKQAEKALQEKVTELHQALDQIKTLRGILPICMNCKKIRDDKGYWNQVEIYVRDHTEADFSHGVCPDCIKILYPDYK